MNSIATIRLRACTAIVVLGNVWAATQWTAAAPGYAQHPRCCWIGGHFIEPKEQNTQQSPDSGRSSAWQLLHS